MLPQNTMTVEREHADFSERLEEFFKVYKQLYDVGKVAPPGSSWQRDNQFSYSMFLVNQHNREIHLDRVENRGMLKAQFEDVDELVNVDVDIRAAVNDATDLSEYPTFWTSARTMVFITRMTCSMYNWRQLASECLLSNPKRRIFLCTATYHVTEDNEQIVDALLFTTMLMFRHCFLECPLYHSALLYHLQLSRTFLRKILPVHIYFHLQISLPGYLSTGNVSM